MPFDDIQVTRFTLFPGTAFYGEYLENTKKDDYWQQYVLLNIPPHQLELFDTSFIPQEIDKVVKVILFSGYWDEGRVRRILDEGAFAFVRKPADAKTLQQALSQALAV